MASVAVLRSERLGLATRVVAIATSAGGLAAVSEILRPLPATLPAAVLVLQHLSPAQHSHLAEILGSRTRLQVREARHGDQLRNGHVYVAPPGVHLLIGADRRVVLSYLPPLHWCRPSADRLFASLGKSFGQRAIAVVLTGNGVDGAEGAQRLRRSGGTVLVQDEQSATCPGMPRAARRAGVVDDVLPLDQIAGALEILVGAGDLS
jgi:two-component system, chemotaxis family, protein-glutamate methylesterase/glutaminase